MYIDQYDLAYKPDFIKRVQVAALTVARDVYSEAQTTPGHAARAALAKQVAGNPAGYAAIFAVGCAVQRADGTPGTDADIFSAISALWNLYAGA